MPQAPSVPIEKAAEMLGMSVRKVRTRMRTLRGLIDPYLHKGQHNKLLFEPEAIAMIERLEQVSQDTGWNLAEAVNIVRTDIAKTLSGSESSDGDKPSSFTPRTDESDRQAAYRDLDPMVQALLIEKDRTISRLEVEITRLNERIDSLMPLALPKPRRGFLGLFGRRSQEKGQ